jgi:hypothetical protein
MVWRMAAGSSTVGTEPNCVALSLSVVGIGANSYSIALGIKRPKTLLLRRPGLLRSHFFSRPPPFPLSSPLLLSSLLRSSYHVQQKPRIL